MTNSWKTPRAWPTVKLEPPSPEVARLNAVIWSLDIFTGFEFDRVTDLRKLAAVAHVSRQWTIEEAIRTQIVREQMRGTI